MQLQFASVRLQLHFEGRRGQRPFFLRGYNCAEFVRTKKQSRCKFHPNKRREKKSDFHILATKLHQSPNFLVTQHKKSLQGIAAIEIQHLLQAFPRRQDERIIGDAAIRGGVVQIKRDDEQRDRPALEDFQSLMVTC